MKAGHAIDRADATDGRNVPVGTQGAAFMGGALWATSSTSTSGHLKAGSETHEFGPGAEEIQFDSNGCLWSVFEAGTLKWPSAFYPLVARFDPGLINTTLEPQPLCAASG